jgi:tetratricopeptide (TPR) repeat protein
MVELDKFEEAISEYLEVIRIEGGDSISFCNLAGCYERTGFLDLARENYTKAAKINPNLAEAWFGIGITYHKEGDYINAVVFFKRAVLLEPDNAEFLLVLAESEYELGAFNESETLYKRLLEVDPGMMEVYMDYSFLLFKLNRLPEAIELVKTALSYDNDCHQYHYRMVVFLYAAAKQQEALLHLEKGLQIHFLDHFLMFEIAPELRNVPAIMSLIDSHRADLI